MQHPGFLKPRYDSGGFVSIPAHIREHCVSGKYDAVVLFLADGFGWRFFEKFQDMPFLRRLANSGKIEKLTSQFPSTTAAHLTTVHTGLPVGKAAFTSGSTTSRCWTGLARDIFLYVKDDLLDEAQECLSSRLADKAEVVKSERLIENGYFGPSVSLRFQARAGNLVILPYRYESVWWYEKDRFEQRFYGHHGGLTPQEMEIPLITLET